MRKKKKKATPREWWVVTSELKLSEWGHEKSRQDEEQAGVSQETDLESKKMGGEVQDSLAEMTL